MFSPDTLILLAFCGACAFTAVATEEFLNYRASLARKKVL
jgi:hypothetical protein